MINRLNTFELAFLSDHSSWSVFEDRDLKGFVNNCYIRVLVGTVGLVQLS